MKIFDNHAEIAIAVDIDGTIASVESEVEESLRRLSWFCSSKGWRLVIATSRPPHAVPTPNNLEERAAGLFFDGGLIATPTPAGLWEAAQEFSVDERDAHQAYASLRRAGGFPLLLLGAESGFDVVCEPSFLGSEACQLLMDRYLLGRRLRASIEPSFDGVRSVSCFVRKETLDGLMSAVEGCGLSPATIVRAYDETRGQEGYGWVEVSGAVTKADALTHLSVIRGWPTDIFLVALGNGENDIGLLEMADLSFCPSDAVASVRGVVTVVGQSRGGPGFVREVLRTLEGRLR